MLGMKGENRLFLPLLQPVIAGHQGVVFVHLAVPLSPVVELTGADANPADNLADRQFGLVAPRSDVIDDFVAHLVRNPPSAQSSPHSFFALTFSSISSAITSFLLSSLAWSSSIFRCSELLALFLPFRSKAASAFSKGCFCHW